MKKIAFFVFSVLLLQSCVFDWKESELKPMTQGDFPEFSTLYVHHYGNRVFDLSYELTIENESALDFAGAYLDEELHIFEKVGDRYGRAYRCDQPCTITVVPCASVKGVIIRSKSYKVEIK